MPDLGPTRGRIKSGRVQWGGTIRSGRIVIGCKAPHPTRALHIKSSFPLAVFFLFASSPRPTNSRPSGTVSAQPVRDRSHLSLRVLATKNKNHPFLIAQEKESCSLMRRLVLFSFVLSVMTFLVISLAFWCHKDALRLLFGSHCHGSSMHHAKGMNHQ